MPLRRSALIALMFALVIAASIRPAGAGQASGRVTGYYVCVLSVSGNGGNTSTAYLSDVIPNTGFRPGPVASAFRNGLGQVNTNQSAQCFERQTEADARQLLQQSAHPGEKLVLTGWKYTAAGAARATPTPSPANPSAPQEPSKGDRGYGNAGPAGPLQGYCFEYAAQKFFITKSFLYGRPTGEGVNEEFSAYVAKMYGAPPYASARCAALRDPTVVENGRQNEINDSRKTPSLELVEIDWTPAPKAAPQVQTPAPATPQTNALDAYNKALAAQRPASNTGGARPASAPPTPSPAAAPASATPPRPAAPPQSSAQAAPLYSYCYAYGTPAGRSGGSVKQRFYITQPFQLAEHDRPNQAFESFLRGAHSGEDISASCLSPGSLETAQKNRQATMDLKRRQSASWDVVEVDWKR